MFGDADYQARRRTIKARFSKSVGSAAPVSASRASKGELGFGSGVINTNPQDV